jgi:DNA polymerase-3 subunit epsilon
LDAIKIRVIKSHDSYIIKKLSKFGFICDPMITINKEASKVNGYIRNHFKDEPNNLYGLPIFSDYAQQLVEFFNNANIVAHNVGFDFSFLLEELSKIDNNLFEIFVKQTTNIICTKQIFAEILGLPRSFEYTKGTSLDTLCDFLNVNRDIRKNGHGSFIDTQLTVDCFIKLLQNYNELIIPFDINFLVENK